MRVNSNLSLVNTQFRKEQSSICASIKKEDQLENTQLRYKQALLYTEANLPQDVDAKVKKIQEWLENISQAQNLVGAFLKPSNGATENPSQIEQIVLNLQKQEKTFQDLYQASLLHANSLVFKSCEETKEKAYDALNEQLFKSKTKHKDEEGILSKASSFFSNLNPFAKNKEKMLDLFAKKVSYLKDGTKECALIKKDELFDVTTFLMQDVHRFSTTSLSQIPKTRYEQIKEYEEHLNVTKALLDLFADRFAKSDFNKVTETKRELAKLLESTFPQSITFNVVGEAQNVRIKLGENFVKPNTPYFLKNGTYTYAISADKKCSFSGEIELELLEDVTIDKDFASMNLPIVNFFTKEGTRIIVDGKTVQPNVETQLPKCEGDVRYVASFADQEKSDTLSLKPNMSETIELKFLTPQELALMSDAKTKTFQTTTQTLFSDSLTAIAKENITFSVKNDCTHGSLELHERGSFTYQSDENFVGVDSFTYTVSINGEKSAPKVVNITVKASDAPVAAIIAPVKEVVADANETVQSVKKKVEEVVEVSEEERQKREQEAEERYQKFKTYVESQEQNVEKLQKLKEKYPDLFERLLKEKLSGM
jgi:VCBS repeat-containing protein